MIGLERPLSVSWKSNSMHHSEVSPSSNVLLHGLSFLWLEITSSCTLECAHCYADSGPNKGHGKMQTKDWLSRLSEARELGATKVQFIGGEPTLHPDFCELVESSQKMGFDVEVFSNCVSLRNTHLHLFKECGVSVATSFYSANPTLHDEITKRQGSWRRTVTALEHLVQEAIPVRVGIITTPKTKNGFEETREFLAALGIDPTAIGHDDVRGIGRGAVSGR